ncbi:MAG: DUF4192 family protein, partial [Micromonosporaceae bacterium]
DATVALRLLIIRFEHDLDAALTGLALGDRPDDTAVAWLATALTIEECCQWAWQRTAAAAEPLSGGRPRADPASGTEPPRGLRAGGGRAGGYLELWRHLTRRAAPSPAAAALLAYAAWLAGNGALAWAAVQRALVAPRYFPAKVMAEVLASGLPPHEITARMAVLRAHRRPGT